ncbi:hypothetical protein PM04_17045 [Thalassobacter sp. 16PALIMAR09]|nr:hypothetical protein PM04_17045 [Thalassobacter sp. 16PALIMAR09]
MLRMDVRSTSCELWPTRVSFFETPVDWPVNHQLAEEAIAAVGDVETTDALSASKRRVRGILERSEAGQALKAHLFACAREVLGPWSSYLDPDHCENRALVIAPGGFISTHKDSREGDLTCVHFLTGGGAGQPVNSVGTPRFVIEDPSRYFDEGRLPYEGRHGYSVNPRPGLSVIFPSHIPHNQHPYQGCTPHVQVVANFRVTLPDALEERLFD